ncbi:hypothetical protein [Amycolatopsis anabasis]|uniref:nSTAND1 domain-containing NTPase n=1 Tax=Amycolatopsis anabasis TaxID=1840409 RepID=UPI001FE5868F|nr:hypothetical protein [Amycolatopsis anabasis]
MPRPERSLDTGDDVLLRFAADLRRLRHEAGGLTLRELGRRAHYASSTLSDAAGGRALPSLAVTTAYVRACGGDVDAWERRWRAVAAALAAAEPEPEEGGKNGEPPSPYAGLAAFQAEDAELFFGRERAVDELIKQVSSRRFVAVFGASGAGKSSLLRAGLLPAARTGVLAEGTSWPAVVLTPGAHPLEECAIQLACWTHRAAGHLHAEFGDDPRNLHRVIRQRLVGEPPEVELALVVDQFEEIFTACGDGAERAAFLAAVLTAARTEGSRCRVVLGVRTDFYTHCAQHADLAEALQGAQLLLGPMHPDELHRAITQPAVRAGCRVEGPLLARIAADAAGQAGALPLVSHALLETWRRRRGNTLTLAGYDAAGGVDGAVARTAEQAYAALTEDQRQRVRQVFLRLVAPGEGTEDTKRRIDRREFDEDPDTTAVLDALARARLLTLEHHSVEIAHEALIRSWPRLRGWIDEDRDGLRVHRQLTDATNTWETLDRDPGSLYRGLRLATAQDWAKRFGDRLTPREREFLDTSTAADVREQAATRRRARRLRRLVALLTVLLVVAATATLYAIRARHSVMEQRNTALARQAVGAAAAMQEANPALAAQLRLAAYRLAPLPEARNGLLSNFATPYASLITSHPQPASAAVFSPDGRVLATGSRDRTVRLFDVSDAHRPRELGVLTGHTDWIHTLVFSPDGRMLASAAADSTARLWDVSDPRQAQPLSTVVGHADRVQAVAFRRDAQVLVTSSRDTTVKVWELTDPRNPALLHTLTGHTGDVHGMELSPDGRVLATASYDKTVRLWDMADPRAAPTPRAVISGETPQYTAVFSPDGQVLATGGRDRIVRLWDVADRANPRPLANLPGHFRVHAAVFSPDGRTLATADEDRKVRLWDVTDRRDARELATLAGHSAAVTSVAFSPDGNSLATTSDDRTVRVEDLRELAAGRHLEGVRFAAFSPDGRTLATGGNDKAIRLWRLDGRRLESVTGLSDHADAIASLAFSPDGNTLVSSDDSGTVRLWDVTDPRLPRAAATLTGHLNAVGTVAFHPGGRILATPSNDKTVRLWDVADPHHPRELANLAGYTHEAYSTSFSSDGNTLAIGGPGPTAPLWDVTDPARPRALPALRNPTESAEWVTFSRTGGILATSAADNTMQLWDLGDPQRPRALTALAGHTGNIQIANFSSDGRLLATGGDDDTVRLWDLTEPRRPREHTALTGHAGPIWALAFSPEGTTLVTGGADRTIRVWDLDVERVANRICAMTYPGITEAEWNRHFPDLPYRPPCG